MKEDKIFYLCDGRDENCERTHCYRMGGGCRHTDNVRHAKSFYVLMYDGSYWEDTSWKRLRDKARQKLCNLFNPILKAILHINNSRIR